MCRAQNGLSKGSKRKHLRCEASAAEKARHLDRQSAANKVRRRTTKAIKESKASIPPGWGVEGASPRKSPGTGLEYRPRVRVRDPKGKSFFAGIGKAGRLAFWDLGGREMADRQSKAIEDFLDSLFLSIAMMIGAIKSGNSGSNG